MFSSYSEIGTEKTINFSHFTNELTAKTDIGSFKSSHQRLFQNYQNIPAYNIKHDLISGVSISAHTKPHRCEKNGRFMVVDYFSVHIEKKLQLIVAESHLMVCYSNKRHRPQKKSFMKPLACPYN